MDDYPQPDDSSLDIIWERLRVEWLHRAGWSDDAIRQLQDNLGLTSEAVDSQQKAYENDPKWPRGV